MSSNAVSRPFDKGNLVATMQPGGGGALTFAPADFSGLMEVANLMAASGVAIPKHLRQSPGMCLSVAMVAYQNGFNPFLLASDTYVVNDVLAYGAKAISAMVNNSNKMEGRLHYDLSGSWPNRVCTVTGKIKGDPNPKVLPIQAATITTRNSPLWKQQPDQQLIYFSTRAWSRVYMPEVLLGMLADDEASEPMHQGPDRARDITPPRPTRAHFAQDAQVVDAEPQPEAVDPYQFIDTDGEVREFDSPHDFAQAAISAFGIVQSREGADDLWDGVSPYFDRMTAEGANDAAEAIRTAGEDAFARLAPPVVDEPAPVALTIPVKGNGLPDHAAFLGALAERLKQAKTVEAFNCWQEANFAAMAESEGAVPKAYARLMEIIDAKSAELLSAGA
ncbi:hypothetical protein A6A04_13275 [Paramagnetospirillum marisnigri]|uniref:Recombinase RecT n=1 Tax=Paramagnetospirillum marisnigri TaxID=1285242 RepID=A0A178MUB9_9PROT|nr:recombinase RecT [Paramagnetospirillum marisnigri]OAN53858.1 hypothetical protein A6A04_13275 [Paramagnetospirillum marisnigri]